MSEAASEFGVGSRPEDAKLAAWLERLVKDPDARVSKRTRGDGEVVFWSTDPRRHLLLLLDKYEVEGVCC